MAVGSTKSPFDDRLRGVKRSDVGESKSISMSVELLKDGLWLGTVLKSKKSSVVFVENKPSTDGRRDPD